MARIPILDENDPATSADAKAYLAEATAARGVLVNFYRALANRPEVGRAVGALADVVYRRKNTLLPRHGELAYLTATVTNNCYY
jgi:hypothetical protein